MQLVGKAVRQMVGCDDNSSPESEDLRANSPESEAQADSPESEDLQANSPESEAQVRSSEDSNSHYY